MKSAQGSVITLQLSTDTLQLTGRVFNFRHGCLYVMHLCCYEVKLPSLKLKTCPEQLLGSLPFRNRIRQTV
jgi:hypothetical protein